MKSKRAALFAMWRTLRFLKATSFQTGERGSLISRRTCPYKFAYSRANGVAVYAKMPTAEQRDFYKRGGIVDAGVPEAGVDGGLEHRKQKASLDALAEGTDRILKRRMNRGFFVSLDREVEYGPYTYWRTQHHEYIPTEGLGNIDGSEFVGVELGTEKYPSLPVAFVWGKDTRGYLVRPSDNIATEKTASLRSTSAPVKLEHRSVLTVDAAKKRGRREVIVSGHMEVRKKDVVVIESVERPKEIPADHKWIAVNLSNQSVVAYDGDEPVYATLASTGRVRSRTIESRNHPTPTGVFKISSKHVSHMMDGDSAIDGPYSIEDVPYVMYFQGAFAFHSAFWHNRFGRPKSHGCVNLAPKDAKYLFFWADPDLPKNWHGVYTRDAQTTWGLHFWRDPKRLDDAVATRVFCAIELLVGFFDEREFVGVLAKLGHTEG